MQQRSIAGFLGARCSPRHLRRPSRRAISLTADTLDKTSRQAMADFHRTRFVPDHARLPSPATSRWPRRASWWRRGWADGRKRGTPGRRRRGSTATGAARVSFVARPNSVQTNLLVGTQAISRIDPDYDVLQVMNKVIGGGPTGRLFIILREEKGYTYGAYSGLSAGRGAGPGRRPAKCGPKSPARIARPADRDRADAERAHGGERVPRSEAGDGRRLCAVARESAADDRLLRHELALQAARRLLGQVPERIAAVTQAQVQAAAKKYSIRPGYRSSRSASRQRSRRC